jgi:hypothetical protein
VVDCSQPNLSPAVQVQGGLDGNSGSDGTYAEVCGYADLDELNQLLSFQVYPNPFNSNLEIQLPESVSWSHPADLTLYNTLGQIIETHHFTERFNSLQLDDLNRGMYLLRISHQGKTATRKVTKK